MNMGNVYAEIALKNVGDLVMVQKGHLNEMEVRKTTVTALVDTGAWTLVISEAVREELGLEVRGERLASLANNATEIVKMVDPVEVQWKDRTMTCQPVLIPGADEVLLGAIPLEDMDLIVDPGKQELIGRHGDKIIKRV